MADAVQHVKTYTEVTGYTLELTPEEAVTLSNLLMSVGGWQAGPRGKLQAVLDALRAAGAEWDGKLEILNPFANDGKGEVISGINVRYPGPDSED